jgi:hypothetical protein
MGKPCFWIPLAEPWRKEFAAFSTTRDLASGFRSIITNKVLNEYLDQDY